MSTLSAWQEQSPVEADVHMLFRKVVRDSIRGISESDLRLGKELMADGYYYLSQGRHSVCYPLLTDLQEHADRL